MIHLGSLAASSRTPAGPSRARNSGLGSSIAEQSLGSAVPARTYIVIKRDEEPGIYECDTGSKRVINTKRYKGVLIDLERKLVVVIS